MYSKIHLRILAIITVFGIFSCQKEIIWAPKNTVPECKNCSYVPFCNGTVYTYIDTMGGVGTGGVGTTVSQTINIIKDTVIDGKIFQKFSNPGADGYYNCTAGVSTLIAYSVPSTPGPVAKLEQTVYKENEPVGATWQNSFDNGLGQDIDYDFEMVAKGLTKTVLGVTYTDVSHVHVTISLTAPVIGTIVMSESDYFYAKNIGLIDNITYSVDQFGGPPTMVMHRVLKTYFIP